jgi:hypothetical protein
MNIDNIINDLKNPVVNNDDIINQQVKIKDDLLQNSLILLKTKISNCIEESFNDLVEMSKGRKCTKKTVNDEGEATQHYEILSANIKLNDLFLKLNNISSDKDQNTDEPTINITF